MNTCTRNLLLTDWNTAPGICFEMGQNSRSPLCVILSPAFSSSHFFFHISHSSLSLLSPFPLSLECIRGMQIIRLLTNGKSPGIFPFSLSKPGPGGGIRREEG